MTDALVSFVVKELGAIVIDEVGLLAGVEKEIESLSRTFSSIQALLADAQRQQNTTEGVRDWLVKIKEVAYEVEDILDEWRTDAFTSQQDEDDIAEIHELLSCLLFPCLCFKQVKSRHNIGHRIKEVRERLNEISKERSEFNLKEVNMGEGMSGLSKEERETCSLIDESEIFGRDEFKEKIIRQLVTETGQKEKPISIVSIVGMGGLGKTAIAQLVHNDARVKAYFANRVWVCVSDPFDVNKIATKIIKSLDASAPDNLDLDTALLNLSKAVGEKPFLLVLDDVWDESGVLWEKLRLPLKGAAPGSGIVVTTRSLPAAEKMETTYIHDLSVLSKSDGWKLFKSIAFKGTEDEECHCELKKIGEQIVESCQGVPLAIRALGSLLRSNRIRWYWEHVLKSEIWNWDIPMDDRILPALLLSYYNLPPCLQRCFSFCSVFSKDHMIKKDELVKLWMANGIIKPKKAEKDVTEEIGEMYFDYLLARSLFQDAERDIDGNVVRCKMHDLVHDLATFVSSGDHCSMEAGVSELYSIKCHHLSLVVKDDVSPIPSLLCKVERLHTLLLFEYSSFQALLNTLFKEKRDQAPLMGERVVWIPMEILTFQASTRSHYSGRLDFLLFNPLRYLRALDLSGNFIENLPSFPSFIGKLKHLRYLNLCGLTIVELPESVTDLCNLQTLKLNKCRDLRRLPKSMRKMVKLRHLEIEETTDLTVLPNGLGRLTSLRTLCKFPLGDENGGCKIGELKELNLLRGKLEIKNLERVMNVTDASEAKLHMKSDLHVLSLSCNDKSDEEWTMLGDDEMKRMNSILEGLRPPHSNLKKLKIRKYAGSMFPNWLEDSKFFSLVKVVLENCKKCILPSSLGKLHSLKYLKIIGADEVKVVGGEFYGNDDARAQETRFPKLEELYFESMLNWEEWKLTQEYGEVMPSLKTLDIIGCQKVKAMPNWLPSTLREVTISNCCKVIWGHDNPLPHLLRLTLSSVTGILSSKPLPYLPALMTLEICGFSCESLPYEGWGLLESLSSLDIYSCPELSSLPEGLGQLKALQTLQIWNCKRLSSLPGGLGHLAALQTMYIGSCEILSSLPKELGQLKALKTLDIQRCERLSSLPEGLGHLEALQTMHIESCEILSSLPEELGQLKALKTLDIQKCKSLSSLPEGLGQLKALHTLRIEYCERLSSLPEGLGQLKALHTLRIECCERLSSLPEGLGQLEALQTLQIFNCKQLSSLPEGLGQLKALHTLDIKNCERLSSLPEGLEQLKALETLYIQNCENLSSLPEGLGQLKALHIENCGILSLPEGKALQILKIWGCKRLSSLFDGFEQLKSLRKLVIWDCPQLGPLPNLQHLTALQRLSIEECPLLTQQLEKEKGEDWCKRSDIPRIDIDDGVDEVEEYTMYLYRRMYGEK